MTEGTDGPIPPLRKRQGYTYGQHWRVLVSAGIDDAFAFLADPRSVPSLEPSWTDLRFLAGPPRPLGLGSEREYIFRWAGFPVYLRLRVAEFDPPRCLALEQVLGPWQSYRRRFMLRPIPGGTQIVEQDDFSGTPGAIDHLVHRLIVARQLRAIAAFRHEALVQRLGAHAACAARDADDDA